MIQYLLDTNIASLFLREGNASVSYRMRLVSPGELAISVVTEAEMLFGLARMPPGARFREAVHHFLNDVAVLPWDSACAVAYANLAAKQERTGKTLNTADAMLAAHAIAYDLIFVSNDGVFRFVEELRLEDWTKGPQPA